MMSRKEYFVCIISALRICVKQNIKSTP